MYSTPAAVYNQRIDVKIIHFHLYLIIEIVTSFVSIFFYSNTLKLNSILHYTYPHLTMKFKMKKKVTTPLKYKMFQFFCNRQHTKTITAF